MLVENPLSVEKVFIEKCTVSYDRKEEKEDVVQ